MKKMQQSAYAKLEINKDSQFFCVQVMPKYFENLIAYL